MIITHEQTIIVPATFEGHEYVDEFIYGLKNAGIAYKRKDSTTSISIKWTTHCEESDMNG